MFPYRVSFDNPGYLLLLAALPVLWWFSFRGLAGLGNIRRLMAIFLRSAVVVLFILSAAEMQWVRTSDDLTVIYCLDQSLSIPQSKRQELIEFVNQSIRKHRDNKDQAGVIVFGREAAIEVPPFDDDVQLSPRIESQLNEEFTNLAGAIKLAQASFSENAAKRIVIVSDGNENLGDAREQAEAAAAAGIGIDVYPVLYSARAEVAVEKVTMPTDVRKGQQFDVRIVLNNSTTPQAGDDGIVGGKLIVSKQSGDQPVVISEEHVELPPGKGVFAVREKIDAPDFYTYAARFVPDDPRNDAMQQNNRATTFTHVRGSGQVLLIEDHEAPGEQAALVDALRKENLEVTVRSSKQLFSSLPKLQQYDTVLLANVPREHFSDQQVTMLARNTQSMGSGLVMLGGPNSFGAGGWTNSEVEEAMPVDFQIKSAKVVPKGALALIMHASEMPEGNFWQKEIAKKAIEALGNEDYCGLIHYGNGDQWLWGGMRKVGGMRERMLGLVDRMAPGDMPQFDPALRMAHKGFSSLVDAAAKHMIIISDGDPSPPSGTVIAMLKALPVTVSTVAVGCHGPAESKVMKDLAQATGGKYYEVTNPRALPKIFQLREARRVARPLIHENDNGFLARLKYPHEITAGIDAFPPLTGYVMTSVKQNPLVEVALVAPEPAGEENATLIASWTYGLGRAAIFTTDTGARWTKSWPAWSDYDKLFSQLVRWSMRPVGDQGKFAISTDVKDGKIEVVVSALDQNDEFLNFLDMSGSMIGPDMKPTDVKLQQTAPGRYVAKLDAQDAGSYFMMLSPGPGQAPLRTGVNVPYSAEFRDRASDVPLLTGLARLAPAGGQPGVVIEDRTGQDNLAELTKVNTFRHDLRKASSSQDVWQLLLFAAGFVFFSDVFVRRVSINLAWVPPLAVRLRDRLLRREPQAAPTEYMERLRSRKAAVTKELDDAAPPRGSNPRPSSRSSSNP